MTRSDAEALVNEWVTDPSLRAHLRDVSTVMHAAAARSGDRGADPDRWSLAGLLHDADWELDPDAHPTRIVAWLLDNGAPDLASAIATHNSAWGSPVGGMAESLFAFDELTGFVVAVAKINPVGIQGVSAASVLKKLRRQNFAASVEREEVDAGAAAVGLTVEDAAAFVIQALATPPLGG